MFSDPIHTISQFDLQSGARVADLGAGSGELAFAAARAVGEAGRVYAVDVQKGLLERIKNHARERRLHNVEVVWGDAERLQGTHLKEGSVDAVLISNLLFQVEDREGLVRETGRILKKGGKALVVDWSESFGGMGPQPEFVVVPDAARRLFEGGGFTFLKSIEAGRFHYGMVFRR